VIAIGDTTTETNTVDETTATPATESAPSDGDDAHDDPTRSEQAAAGRRGRRRPRWARILAFAALPGLALVLAGGAGYLKWQYDSARGDGAARTQSVAAATESTIELLSYQPRTADQQLTAARGRLTGTFRDSYSSLIHDVVIPGAQQKQISAVATVPGAASVSATADHAVVLVFVDQTITAGTDTPSSTASSVKVTLDKVGDQWLISDFTPV
jgi:Mce-associated membrane protein